MFVTYSVLPKIKNFFSQLLINYKTIIFEKALNSNLIYGICIIFKYGWF